MDLLIKLKLLWLGFLETAGFKIAAQPPITSQRLTVRCLAALGLGMLMRLSFMPISAWWIVWPVLLMSWRLIFAAANFWEASSILSSWWLGLFSVTLLPWVSHSLMHYAYFSWWLAALAVVVLLAFLVTLIGWCGGLLWLAARQCHHRWLFRSLMVLILLLMETILARIGECAWFNLAYTQLGGVFIGLVPLIGSLGMTLVVLWHLVLSYEWFIWLPDNEAEVSAEEASRLHMIYMVFSLGALLLSGVGWFYARHVTKPQNAAPLTIQVVQQATRPDQKWQSDWETLYLTVSGLESWLHNEQLCSQESLSECLRPVIRPKTSRAAAKLLIWPEGAIAEIVRLSDDFWQQLSSELEYRNIGLISGCLIANEENNAVSNGLLGLGLAHGVYRKQRLLPFGEYVPGVQLLTERWQRYLARIIPFSNLTAGEAQGPSVTFTGSEVPLLIGTAICSELGYQYLLSQQLPEAQLLVTIGDDSWFSLSASLGWLHLGVARMRSLESGRYQVWANNSGPSAIIDPMGRVLKAPSGKSAILEAKVYPLQHRYWHHRLTKFRWVP